MKILAIGDIVGENTIKYIADRLWQFRDSQGISFVTANGENVSNINGITPKHADALLDCGIDFLTTGNHVFGKKEIYGYLDESPSIIRPANYPAECPGTGYKIVRVEGYKLLCMNVMGSAFMDPLASPFDTVDAILSREKGNYDFSMLDIHAEATSEKIALARYFDGRINIIYGTHTHVQTADEMVLPEGSGYITDLGMSGPVDSVLGTAVSNVIDKFRKRMPVKFNVADGRISVSGAIFDLDTSSMRVRSVARVKL